MDFDKKGKATAQLYDLNTFMSSNGLKFKPLNNYGFGPDVDTEKLGFFLQSQFEVTDRLNLQAGVRHERIDSQVQIQFLILKRWLQISSQDITLRL
jgi:iron complex outermembrane receptor protein